MILLFSIISVSIVLQIFCIWNLWKQVKETDEFLKKLQES